MKKFIKKSLYFALFFLLFFFLINCIFLGIIAITDWDFVKRLKSLKFDNPDYELLVFGSSLAEYGIDTKLLSSYGIKSFNLSLVGSSIKTNYIQLNEYLTKYSKKPRYVLLGINSYLERFDQDGIQPVVEFTMKNHKYGIKDVPISKFNWAGMELLKKAIKKGYRKQYVSYGQKKTYRTSPDNSDFNELYLNIKKFESAHWIGEIAKLCNQNGIKFIIIEMPGIRETQNLSEIGPYTIYLPNRHSAVLYNFNNQNFCVIFDANKDWSGLSHFNSFGGTKFTKELIKVIRK